MKGAAEEITVAGRERELSILLIEDNPGDVLMVREALAEAGIAHRLDVVSNGGTAMGHLRALIGTNREPDLVILDLNLPAMNGREIMAAMQEAAELRKLPVAVLSTYGGEGEICDEFPQLRMTFAAKTANFRELVEIVREFRRFARPVAEGA